MPETAGVHFLLRPHHYVLKVITQFRKCRPRANTSMEASFTGYIRKKWYFWMDKSKRDIYFHNLLGIKWHIQTGRNAVPAGRVMKVVAARLSWTALWLF